MLGFSEDSHEDYERKGRIKAEHQDFFFYPSNLKNEVTLTKKEKVLREASLKKDPELSFGDVKLAILIRHPSIDAK